MSGIRHVTRSGTSCISYSTNIFMLQVGGRTETKDPETMMSVSNLMSRFVNKIHCVYPELTKLQHYRCAVYTLSLIGIVTVRAIINMMTLLFHANGNKFFCKKSFHTKIYIFLQ